MGEVPEFPEPTPQEVEAFEERAQQILGAVEWRQSTMARLFGEPEPQDLAEIEGEMALAKIGVARFIDNLMPDDDECDDPVVHAHAAISRFVMVSRYWDESGNTITAHLYAALRLLAERQYGEKFVGFDMDKIEREMNA